MSCSQSASIDPLQNIIDETDKHITTLETQALGIVSYVESFRSQGTGFDAGSISSSSTINSALSSLTSSALCASQSDIEPVNELTEDCLNTALSGIRKFANNILEHIENGIDNIQDILDLPENALMKLLQKLMRLTNTISELVAGIDRKLQCVSASQQASEYADQLQALQDRVDTVTGDLYLADDGSFDSDKLMTGFDSSLKDNIESFKTKSETVQTEINTTIDSTLGTSTKNPKRYY